MHKNVIFAGIGGLGVGALLGWAITGDYHTLKARRQHDALRRVIDEVSIENYHNYRLATMRQEELESRPERPNPFVDFIPDGPDNGDMYITNDEGEVVSFPAVSEEIVPEESASSQGVDEIANGVIEEVTPEVTPAVQTEEDEDAIDEAIEKQRTNLQKLIDGYTPDPAVQREFGRMIEREENDKRPPFVIPVGVYTWDEEGADFAKVTLTYFPASRILIDEDEELVDVKDYVGWRALSRFGDESDDADTVYVRNPRLLTDYEVIRDEENEPPLHIRYGMPKAEFEANKKAGRLRFGNDEEGR